MALPSFSQAGLVDSSNTKVDPAKLICLPDSVLRKAAQRIVLSDEMEKELKFTKSSNHFLNRMLFFKDSVAYEDSLLLTYKETQLMATKGQLQDEKDQRAILKKQYSYLKFNDRMKMGLFATIFVGLIYVYIEKK